MKLPVEQKVMGGFALTLCIICMVSGLAYWSNTQFIQAESRLREHQEILKELESLLSQVKDAQTGQQDYVITGEEHHLKPYRTAIVGIEQELKSLRQLTLHRPKWHQQINELEWLITQKLDWIEKTISLRQTQGFEAAQKQIITHQGLNLMEDIRQKIQQLESEEKQHKATQLQQVRIKTQRTKFVILLSDGIAFAGIILAMITIHRDLQKRRKIENHLTQLAKIIQSSHDAILAQNLEGIILSWNQGAERIFGYTAGEVIGQPIFILIPPNYQAETAQILPRIQQGEQIDSYETVWLHKEGYFLNLLVTFSPIKDATGNLIGLSLIQHDITHHKQVEAVCRESQALLTGIIEGSQDLIAALDLEYKFIAFNRVYQAEFLTIFGVEIQIDTVLMDALAHCPEQQARAVEMWSRALAGEEFTTIQELGDSQGQRNYYEVTYSSIRDQTGRQIGASHIVRNVNERISVERKLRQYERIVSATTDGLVLLDTNLIYLEANQAYLDLHQKRYDEVMGHSVKEIVGPELFDSVVQPRCQLCLAGENVQYEMWFDSPTEGPQYLSITYTPCREADQTISGIVINLRKITELKQVEDALQVSEERYRHIVETATEGIWEIDAHSHNTFINQKMAEMLGYSVEEMLSMSLFDVIDPEELAIATANVKRRRQGIQEQHDFKFRRKDGSTLWAIVSTRPIFDSNGHYQGALGMITDITQRKQAELALRESEARFQAFMYYNPALAWITNADLKLVYLNQAYSRIFHVPVETAIGKSLFDLFPTEFAQQYSDNIQTVINTNQVLEAIETAPRYDGTIAEFLVYKFPIPRLSEQHLVGGLALDITERKKTERQLELQDVIVKTMAEGICLVRAADAEIVYANPKFERMFGYEVGELAGQPVAIINYQDETIDPLQVHLDIAHLIDIYGEYSYEVYNLKKDGTPFWCRATTSRFEHPDYGTVYVAVQEDISERKKTEEQIKASLREKEVLLREIHHRVKNNLQIIDGLLQLQYRRTQEPKAAAILLESQHRIKSIALVHEKLYRSDDLAKISFSEYIPNLISSLLDSYSISSRSIHLSINVEDVSLDIDTAIPCGLIINELVSNILKHAFSDNCEHGEIEVEFRTEPENTLSLRIRDNGIGFPQGFDICKTRSLGLKLVQGLVMQLEGILKIKCQTGTEFTIFFPRGKI